MATPRERLNELRALQSQQQPEQAQQLSPRQRLEQLRAAQTQQPVEEQGFIDQTLSAAGDIAKRQFAPLAKAAEIGATSPTAGIETGAALASGIVAEPVAGLAGIAQSLNPFADEGAGARAVEGTKEALTFQPRTEGAKELVQDIGGALEPVAKGLEASEEFLGEAGFKVAGPVGGAIGETLPTAALEALGLGTAKKISKAGKLKESIDIQKKTVDAVEKAKPVTVEAKNIGSVKSGAIPEVRDYQEILENLKNKKTKNAAIDAMPDQDILKAADDLGVDLNPDHYSSNRVFQEVTQSLKSRPGSTLGAKEQRAIEQLGQQADNLIDDIGGKIDKSLLDQGLKNEINTTIASLQSQSDKAYATVGSVIPKTVKVKPIASQAYIKSTLEELGGDKTQLAASEKKLLGIMDNNPTYAAIDRLRKDVGDGFRKNSGPYKDENAGTLKQVYRALSEDQQGVADIYGVGDDYASARKLVQSRKQIEDNAIKLFGKDAEGSIVAKMKAAGTKLTKGDLSDFNRLMNSVPSNRQTEVAATMLNDLFTQGSRKQGSLGQGFVGAFEGLNKNKGAKNILFSKLPPDARRRFDNLGKVSVGLFRSKALENTSKTARDVISAMDDGGLFNKIISSTVGKIPGTSTTTDVISGFLSKSKASTVADNFLTSPKFRQAIEVAAKSNKPKSADAILRPSKEFKAWKSMLSDSDKKLLASQGFISFITSQEEEQ